jgi:hypothetical protein
VVPVAVPGSWPASVGPVVTWAGLPGALAVVACLVGVVGLGFSGSGGGPGGGSGCLVATAWGCSGGGTSLGSLPLVKEEGLQV